MGVADHHLGDGADPGPAGSIGGKNRCFRIGFLQVFHDRDGLGQDAIAVDQRRNPRRRVEVQVFLFLEVVGPASTDDINRLVLDPLERQRDPGPVAR